MFEQLVNEAASRLNLSASSISGLLRALLSMITSERTGGPEGFVDRFRRAGLGDVITSWFGGQQGTAITSSQLESALGAGALDSLAGAAGLTRMAATSALTFLLPRVIGRLTPTGAFPSTSALRAQVSGFIDRPATVPVAARKDVKRGWPAWLPWAAVAIALLAFFWLRTPGGSTDPQLTITNRDGKVSYSGVVRDASTQLAIEKSLRSAFGAGNVAGSIRIDRNAKTLGWLPYRDELMSQLKAKPGVDFSLTGNRASIGGWLSPADREALRGSLSGILGSQTSIAVHGDAAADAVRTANDQASAALGAIGTSGVTTTALVQAMNLAVINFPSGSAEIPADNLDILRKSASAIKHAPSGSTIEIGGHTDNTGDPAANLTLSQARADAVKAALVSDGVPAAMLTAKGYGDTRPRASNDTEYGRFQNRRIEYTVLR